VVVLRPTTTDQDHAFRWTAAGGMVDLGSLGGTLAYESQANGVSADGNVIVGYSDTAGDSVHAFRWTATGGMTDIGTLGGRSYAKAVSADGNVVVGRSETSPASFSAFRWTEAGGMQSVAAWLNAAGVSTAGTNLEDATGTNADGSIVVGNYYNPSGDRSTAWLARVSAIGSGVMQPANYSQSLGALNASFHHAQSLTRMILWGSHHRPLMSYGSLGQAGGQEAQNCFWANGDVGNHSNGRDSDESLAEIGLCRDFANGALRAGLGLGHSRRTQSLGQFGENKLSGNHLVGEVNYQLPSGPLLSLTGVFGDWSADIRRGYAAAVGTDYSKGDTRVKSTALRFRADWNDAWRWHKTAVTPYVALTSTRTKTDGYTETGGGFPARFDGQQHTALESRLGAAATHALSGSTNLRSSLELVHRFDGNGPNLSGQSLGLFTFNEPGAETRKSWVRAGLDLDHRLSKNVSLGLSLHLASKGEDPTVSAAVSLRVGF
jgi:probable HAF family extracellular repeat protein